MKIVLTNDDGFGEPGLIALEKALKGLGELVVIAPEKPQSCCGHRVTMRGAIAVEEKDVNTFMVDGTPADCVRLALKKIAPDADWVIAGINPGANLGSDVYQSGTVAAAREAAILGVKGIALSHYIGENQRIDWSVASMIARRAVEQIVARSLRSGEYVNVNFPSPLTGCEKGELVDCFLDAHPHTYGFLEKDGVYYYEGVIHDRPRSLGSDVDVCFSGSISHTRLKI